jgi:hypothetical protein
MESVSKILFKIADVLAYLFILGAFISVLVLPFSEVEHLYQTYKGWEPSWLGIFLYALNSVIIGVGAYFFLHRRVRFFALLASISIIGTMFIQSVIAGFWLMGFVLFMLAPCYLAIRGASQDA